MKGEFNGLTSLILKENSSAYYVHCFAHQLQLILVAIAENHEAIAGLFSLVSAVLNCVGGSCKRCDSLRGKEVERVVKQLLSGEITTGRGKNQELGVKRPGATRWGSHHGTIINFRNMFSSIVGVLEILEKDGESTQTRGSTYWSLTNIQTFDFVFVLFLMNHILGLTSDLSEALQKKDQDIVNAMKLMQSTKYHLNTLRNEDDVWESFLEELCSFCRKHGIQTVPKMDEIYHVQRRRRRGQEEKTNIHHYRNEIFRSVIDMLLNELNDRFNEANTELLLCVACLDPSNGFAKFDRTKLIRLSELYPWDFSAMDIERLGYQLDNYIFNILQSPEFSKVDDIAGLARKLVELKQDRTYNLVYRLLKLALLLPVVTATVERVFSAIKLIKSCLRNRMGDEFMNDCLIAYVERDIANGVNNETIMHRYQNMGPRRGTL